jgi:hypothetical protein
MARVSGSKESLKGMTASVDQHNGRDSIMAARNDWKGHLRMALVSLSDADGRSRVPTIGQLFSDEREPE